MVPIPEGSETHSEESGFTSYGSSQEMLDQPGCLTGSGECELKEEQSTVEDVQITGLGAVSGACELSG